MEKFDEWFEENSWHSQLKEILREAYEKGFQDSYVQAHETGYNAGYVAGVKKEQAWREAEKSPNTGVSRNA